MHAAELERDIQRMFCMVFCCAVTVFPSSVCPQQMDIQFLTTFCTGFSCCAVPMFRSCVHPRKMKVQFLRMIHSVFSCCALPLFTSSVHPQEMGVQFLGMFHTVFSWALCCASVCLHCALAYSSLGRSVLCSTAVLCPCSTHVYVQQRSSWKSRGRLAWYSHAFFHKLHYLRFQRTCDTFCSCLLPTDQWVWLSRTSFTGFTSFGWPKPCLLKLWRTINGWLLQKS